MTGRQADGREATMTDLAAFEQQIMQSVAQKVHDRVRKAREAQLGPEMFGDPEDIADAMVAALPLGHVFDEVSGPFYDTAGLSRWLQISRQALHQRVARHAILACPLDGDGVVYPAWQFLDGGATIPSLAEVLATLHGYAVAFWWAAVFFGVGAILTLGLLESGVPDHDAERAAL